MQFRFSTSTKPVSRSTARLDCRDGGELHGTSAPTAGVRVRSGYNDYMPKRPVQVGSRELKTRLGTYLARVRKGETILVTDRGEPVAELRPIVPPAADATEAALEKMAAEGLITRPMRKGPLQPFVPIRTRSGRLASDIIIEDREDRRLFVPGEVAVSPATPSS